jgi:hypothetical protein
LAALIPARKLNGFNAMLGAIFSVFDQLFVGKKQAVLRRIDLDLLP